MNGFPASRTWPGCWMCPGGCATCAGLSGRRCLAVFINAYRAGLTPNPCVLCNRHIKFGLLLAAAEKSSRGGLFASGHYADKVCQDNRWFLREPADRRKSQIYFLAMIDPAVLERVLFPIAGLTIDQVRARVAGLPLANMAESQDVCFLQEQSLVSYLSSRIPECFVAGDILDVEGKKLAAMAGPSISPPASAAAPASLPTASCMSSAATWRPTPSPWAKRRTCSPVPWSWAARFSGGRCGSAKRWRPKIRYQLHGHEAEIVEVSPTRIRAVFKKPVRAVTPGQFGVFYDGDVIVAAGEIVAE